MPVGDYSTLTMQPYLSKLCYPTKDRTLTFLFQGNDEYAGARRQKKIHGRQSLALPDAVHNQDIEQPYFNINSNLLVSTQSSARPCILFCYKRDRDWERGANRGANVYCSIFPYSICHLPRWQTVGRTQPVLSISFFVDFHACKFRSFVSLDGSRQSVFVWQSSHQLIV